MHLLKCSIQKSHRSLLVFLSKSFILSKTMPAGSSGALKSDFSPTTKSTMCGFLTSQLWHLVGIIFVGTDLKSVPDFHNSCLYTTPLHTIPRIITSSRFNWLSEISTVMVLMSHPFATIAGLPSALMSANFLVR